MQKIESTVENWENCVHGADEAFAKPTEADSQIWLSYTTLKVNSKE